jgi:hypothetical protein
VLAPDDIFLFFSSDVLSLDFLEESDIGFPFSTSTEMEVGEFIARVHFLIKSNWQLKANNIIVACMLQVANEGK